MGQFDLHRNPSAKTSRRIPYLLNVQADATRALPTRLVCPVRPRAAMAAEPIDRVHVPVSANGEDLVVLVTELASVPLAALGDVVASLQDDRAAIIGAIDLLVVGFYRGTSHSHRAAHGRSTGKACSRL